MAGLCPITEANLGDGIFDGQRYLAAGGRFGVGSDSNVRISLTEELRLLEYSQRLGLKGRAILADAGAVLRAGAVSGRGAGRGAGGGAGVGGDCRGAVGRSAGAGSERILIWRGPQGDTILDTFIFARDDRMVQAVWSAGPPIWSAVAATMPATP